MHHSGPALAFECHVLRLAAARRYARYTAKAMADRKWIAGLMR